MTGNFATLAKFFIDIICKFDDFRASVNTLIAALGEKDILKKYFGYGKFVGSIIKNIGTAKRRLMLKK